MESQGRVLVFVDFRARIIVDRPAYRTVVEHSSAEPEITDVLAHFDYMINCIRARYGTNQPKQGVIYEQNITSRGFDTYGWGCVHNSVHQYFPKKGELWNRPMPMPADIRHIKTVLYNKGGQKLRCGLKSDPFTWMDQKYGQTKKVLMLANEYKVRLKFHTMSDLCAHDDYIHLIEQGGHEIVMQMGFEHLKFADPDLHGPANKLERQLSPGAPSLGRRVTAIQKLESAGVKVTRKYTDLRKLIKNKSILKEICRRTGTGESYWTGGDALKAVSRE